MSGHSHFGVLYVSCYDLQNLLSFEAFLRAGQTYEILFV